MTFDEDFLQEMQDYIKRFHKENGANDKIATLLANFNIYYCRSINDLNEGRFLRRACIIKEFKENLNSVINRFKEKNYITNYELMKILYDELTDIINEEEIRKEQEKNITTFIFIEDGIVKYRHAYD